ncbi:receptor-type tyrosine-protein phosphatase V-like [Echinops telfairi]|uniref:Receptor-type tyrosine-protein phosphatase V-like n=1 Tax=Echinops telfairi TaxID=9371 RepID=A0AC55DQU8_ECHTE|nr:receptor-type tyrosine-protein phosphatase V-like [Echinops telfairi]
MRPPVLLAVLLWLCGVGAEEDGCPSLEGRPDRENRGLPLEVNISSQGESTSLFVSWAAPESGEPGHALHLTHLSHLGAPDGQPLQGHTNASSFEFQGLVPGGRYRLEVTALGACAQNATATLTTRTAPMAVQDLQLRSSGSPTSLQALWGAAPGEQDGYWLLLSHPASQTLAHNISVPPDTRAYSFGDLMPESQYVLEVSTWAGSLHAKTSIHQWTAPLAPGHLELRALGTGTLQAFWNGSEGAAWLHLLLMDLLGGTNVSTVVGQGVSNYTFLHLSPGTPYQLMLTAAIGPLRAVGPNAMEWTYPSTPLELVLTPQPPELRASWKAGPGARDGYLLRLSGPVERNTTLGPGDLNATFPGPLPAGHYALELKVLAGPYDAWAQASAWLDDAAAQPSPGHGATLQLDGLEATREPERRALLYASGDPGLLGNISVPSGATQITFCGLVPGAGYRVDIASPRGVITRSLKGHTRPLAPQSLKVTSRDSPSELTVGWAPAPGQQEGYMVAWDQEGTQRPLGRPASMGPDTSSWTLRALVPGSCYVVSVWAWAGNLNSSLQRTRACTAHAPGGRDSYQVTLYQAGVWVGSSTTGPEIDSTSFLALTPGTKYEVEVVSKAGPLQAVAANVSGWTSPLLPNELLVSMQAGSAVVNLAWASGALGQGQCHARLSEAGYLTWEEPLVLGQAHLILRGLTPGRNLSLSVLCQAGPLQASTHSVVLPVEPGPVEDVQCQPEATHLTLNWTVPPGDVGTCLVVAEQLTAGGHARLIFRANTSGDAVQLSGLVPGTSYRLSLTALARNGLWSRAVTLVCTTSAEVWQPPELAEAPELEPELEMGVVIPRAMFGDGDGLIQWYGVIATTNMSLVQPPREAINCTWYDHYYGGQESYLAVLLPNPFYPGPWAVPVSWSVPIGTEDCGQTQEICNGQLKTGAPYRFSVAAFSRSRPPEPVISFSAFSEPRARVSRAAVPLPVVVGITASCILVVCAMLGLLSWLRVRGQRAEKNQFPQELTMYNLRRTHRPVPMQSFQQSYEAKSARAHQAFFQEFEELKEVGREQPRLEAEHPANATKNRYPHVLPYDHSRVRLTQLEGEPHSDYINANFIPGYTHPQEFIATQGPLKRTLEDFWRLVWEQQVHTIVMLTVGMENGRVLCEHYWPADSTPITLGHITVYLLVEEPEDEWTKREFRLQHASEHRQRRVKQLQFTTWPDHSIPEAPSSLLTFVELVREQARATQGFGPTLVHCSAGVGRTGTFVALMRLLQQLEQEQVVDVFNTVYALRLHRPLMIQTPSQYIFLHSCLLNKILEGPSDTSEPEKTRSGSWGSWAAFSPLHPSPRCRPISVKNFTQACVTRAADANAGFLQEYELLLQAIEEEASSSTPPPGCEQRRSVSYDRSEGHFPPLAEGSHDEMLEAWLFPGGPSGRDHMVVTGPTGPEELWELVWEHGAHVLVSLCPPEAQKQEFWPTERHPIVTAVVTVQWVADSSTLGWPCTLLRVTHGESRKERQVQQLQFPPWQPGCELPFTTLLPFLAAVDECCAQGKSRKQGTLLSHSSKGVAQLGLFLAMERLLQQAAAECIVDVFNVALQQSQACSLMTPTLEQYIYFYNCLNRALGDKHP